MALDEGYFEYFADLRKHVESAFWYEAVRLLTEEDHGRLKNLATSAWSRLKGNPVQIPHEEHKQLHLTIFSRHGNPFVHDILQAYWEAYEAVGLNLYTDYSYLKEVRLSAAAAGTTVDAAWLKAQRLVRRSGPIKLLAGGELKVALTVKVDADSETARKAVEAAGGKVETPNPKA